MSMVETAMAVVRDPGATGGTVVTTTSAAAVLTEDKGIKTNPSSFFYQPIFIFFGQLFSCMMPIE
jgi:hypothetical protein